MLDAALEFLDGEQALHAEIPHELSKQPRVSGAEDAEGELREHECGRVNHPGGISKGNLGVNQTILSATAGKMR